jgi:hypothetical protein
LEKDRKHEKGEKIRAGDRRKRARGRRYERMEIWNGGRGRG